MMSRVPIPSLSLIRTILNLFRLYLNNSIIVILADNNHIKLTFYFISIFIFIYVGTNATEIANITLHT